MTARIGGAVMALIGLLLTYAGGGLGLALLGRPLPDVPLLRDLAPHLQELAARAPLPPGSDWGALAGSTLGIIALGGFGGGLMVVLGGVTQMLTGRRSALSLVLVVAGLCGLAAAAVFA